MPTRREIRQLSKMSLCGVTASAAKYFIGRRVVVYERYEDLEVLVDPGCIESHRPGASHPWKVACDRGYHLLGQTDKSQPWYVELEGTNGPGT